MRQTFVRAGALVHQQRVISHTTGHHLEISNATREGIGGSLEDEGGGRICRFI